MAELMRLSKVSTDEPDEHYKALQAELDWATDLLALAKPIPLDDSTAYTEVFDVGAEGERAHVQKQLTVIYNYLDVAPTDNYFASRSTADLKYELYSLLIHDVIPLRGSDQDPLAAQLFRSYSKVAGVSPQDAVNRLQGTYREPDVLGFLFVVGLTVGSMVFEPLDWALTTVDIINALSEGDIESAVGNFVLGVVPFASSRMDDAFRLLDDLGAARRGGPLDNIAIRVDVPAGTRNWKLDKPSPTGKIPNQLKAESCVAACGVELFERTTGLRITEQQMLHYMGYDGSYGIPMGQGFDGLVRASDELAAQANAPFIGTHMDVYGIAEEIAEGNTVVAALGRHAVIVESVDLQSGIVTVSDPWGLGPGKGVAHLGELPVERFTELQRIGGGYQVIIGISGNR